jgi:hypothetical protein
VFSICEATNGGGAGLGVSLLLQYGDDHLQTSRAAFFLLPKLSVLAKRNFQMTNRCVFFGSLVATFSTVFSRSFAEFPYGSLAFSQKFEGILNVFLLSYPFYGQIWLNCIMANQFSYITNMKTKRTITSQASIPFPCSKTSLP